MGRTRTMHLFHQMAERVPAYRDFLKKHGIDHKKIAGVTDLKHIPTLDKDNYLRSYPKEALCWDGEFRNKSWTISTTSGSTGTPYYFPRENSQDWQYAVMAELYLRANFNIQDKSTLYIVAFPMGAWIGGVFTYEAVKIVAERGRYNLSVITPGINKKEIIEAVKQLGKNFDQVLIGSYAPFLKDILDDGEHAGIKWKDYNLGFIFSAEGFNEVFRDYVIKKTGLKNIYRATLNHYGTVDLGTMAHETPLSIMLRRDALENSELYNIFFPMPDKLPTLAQYNPAMFYFEEDGGNLLCSAFSGIPLVRYDLKDSGGILGFERAKNRLKLAGYDFEVRAAQVGISDTIWKLPFVYVYERSDFSVSFYAFQVYPETIRRALQVVDLEKAVTGKFTMSVDYNKSGQQKLKINVELKANQNPSPRLEQQVRSQIIDALLAENSEYRETHIMQGEKVYPEIIFWPYEDVTYFKPGIKQKWVMK